MNIVLPPDLIDWLLNYELFNCRNCGQGVSVATNETPDCCARCGGTTFEKVDEDRPPS